MKSKCPLLRDFRLAVVGFLALFAHGYSSLTVYVIYIVSLVLLWHQ